MTRRSVPEALSDASLRPWLMAHVWRAFHARVMPNYRRVRVPGGTYFFTVNLLERHRRLLVERIDVLRLAFAEARAARPFFVVAAVVLPDHLHCVWTLPPGDADNATRWRHIKTAFARALPSAERRSPRRVAKGERGVWQRRYWEHLIRDERDLAAHVDYVHFNPVKHGHAVCAAAWPYSSVHRYVARGDLAADWGVAGEAAGGGGERARGGVREAGQDPPYARPHPRRAASMAAMSILRICIIASNARLAAAGSGSVMAAVSARGP